MKKLSFNLKNCFGIRALNSEFNFEKSNVVAIYARNGLMKTSFAKTLKLIQEEEQGKICDAIYEIPGEIMILSDGEKADKDKIFVVNSYEDSYESDNIVGLLLDAELKQKIDEILNLRLVFLKKIEVLAKLKISRKSKGKMIFELEPTLTKDFGFKNGSFLLNIQRISLDNADYFNDISYADIFEESVLKKIKSKEFQTNIYDFMKKVEEICTRHSFLQPGKFTLPKLKNIKNELNQGNYFVRNNKIKLNGGNEISNIGELDKVIKDVESEISGTKEIEKIESALNDTKGLKLRDIIESHTEIIPFLKTNKLDELKIILWKSYFKAFENDFNSLKERTLELENNIKNHDFKHTPWQKAVDIFNKRFHVPYKMQISNLESSIMGESLPIIDFIFNDKEHNARHLNRKKLDDLNVLSQGEKRSLYLLNVIFDVEQRKIEKKETIYIIDDIADSFDYKNKYAIVEYLSDMCKEDNNYLIIMSHNFDFYRTISKRLSIERHNRLIAYLDKNKEIKLYQEVYQNNLFLSWKKQPNARQILALIPFVRNLIEYGKDDNIACITGIENDNKVMTCLLHKKVESESIRISDLQKVYQHYLGQIVFPNCLNPETSVHEVLQGQALTIQEGDIFLENKIILSMSIRLLAESYMLDNIKPTKKDFKKFIVSIGKNQTRELLKEFNKIGNTEEIAIMEAVNIMTPENIHFNAFMYEPLVDMDIVELLDLYKEVLILYNKLKNTTFATSDNTNDYTGDIKGNIIPKCHYKVAQFARQNFSLFVMN